MISFFYYSCVSELVLYKTYRDVYINRKIRNYLRENKYLSDVQLLYDYSLASGRSLKITMKIVYLLIHQLKYLNKNWEHIRYNRFLTIHAKNWLPFYKFLSQILICSGSLFIPSSVNESENTLPLESRIKHSAYSPHHTLR